jgi:hypothetical protein
MELPQYKLRVKRGEEPPEEWSRLLVTFAGVGGIRLIEEYTMECVIEAGPVTRKMIEDYIGDYVDIFPYTPGEHTDLSIKDEYDEAKNWWRP